MKTEAEIRKLRDDLAWAVQHITPREPWEYKEHALMGHGVNLLSWVLGERPQADGSREKLIQAIACLRLERAGGG